MILKISTIIIISNYYSLHPILLFLIKDHVFKGLNYYILVAEEWGSHLAVVIYFSFPIIFLT